MVLTEFLLDSENDLLIQAKTNAPLLKHVRFRQPNSPELAVVFTASFVAVFSKLVTVFRGCVSITAH